MVFLEYSLPHSLLGNNSIEALATYHRAVAEAERLMGGELAAVTDASGPQRQEGQP